MAAAPARADIAPVPQRMVNGFRPRLAFPDWPGHDAEYDESMNHRRPRPTPRKCGEPDMKDEGKGGPPPVPAGAIEGLGAFYLGRLVSEDAAPPFM